jgi:hypothetical protein
VKPESIATTGGPASRLAELRRRCLLVALVLTSLLAATTFDFQPLLPDDGQHGWTMLILGLYLYLVWPASLLGLAGSVVLYVATLVWPDYVARKLLRSTQ